MIMEFSYKMEVDATKEDIWGYYADIQKWYTWEEDLEDISLNGAFEKGTMGVMKLAGMPPIDYTLVKVERNRSFCDKAATPMGDVYFDHEILEENDGLYIKHTVRLECEKAGAEQMGFLKQVFSDVPDAVAILKREVEK